jgi:hypothetical protein
MSAAAPAVRVRLFLAVATCLSLICGLVTVSATAALAEPGARVGNPAKFVPLQPERILDTRNGTGAAAQQISARGTLDLQVLGAGGVPATEVSAVVLNVTITGTSGTGHVSVNPAGTDGRDTSVINHTDATRTIPGLVTAPIGAGGKVTLYTSNGGHLLADVFGYYTEVTSSDDGRFVALPPSRSLDTRDGTGAEVPPNPGDRVHCTDFTTWSASNDYFWRYYPHYGDVARLDQDNDQIPCEGLPGAPATAQRPAQPKPAAQSTVGLQVTGRNGVPSTGVAAVAPKSPRRRRPGRDSCRCFRPTPRRGSACRATST